MARSIPVVEQTHFMHHPHPLPQPPLILQHQLPMDMSKLSMSQVRPNRRPRRKPTQPFEPNVDADFVPTKPVRNVDCPVRLFADRMAGVTLAKGRKDPKRLDEGRMIVREFLAKRSEAPHSDVLSILCRSENGTSLHDSINADVTAMLLEELDDWTTKVGENGSGIPFLVKKRAFNVFSSNRGSAFAGKVAKAFRMVPDRMRFRRCISRLVSRRGYAKALRWIRALNLPLTYSVTKILLNLLVRGQLSEIRAYFDISPVERAPFLKIVDKILGLRYQERLQFLEDNKVRGLKFWSLTERNLTRAIIRLLPKSETDAANILKECVNMNRCKSARLFKDVITKTFVHESMTENKFASLVRGIIGGNMELAEMFINCLFDRDLWREAQLWMDIYHLESPDLLKQLRRYQAMDGLFSGAVQHLSYLEGMSTPPSSALQYVPESAPNPDQDILQIPEDKITHLTSSEECAAAFDQILEVEKAIAFDAEWKPVLKKGLRPTLALFQIATSDRVYLIDVVKLGGSLSEDAANKLRQIFTTKPIRKLAFAMGHDLGLLGDLHPVLADVPTSVEGLWDFKVFRDRSFDFLKTLYPEVEMDGPYKLGNSLAALIKVALGKTLPKPVNIRCSDWSCRPLTKEQIKYAALDAYCLLMLYDALKAKSEEKNVELESFLDLMPRGRTRSPSMLRTPSVGF